MESTSNVKSKKSKKVTIIIIAVSVCVILAGITFAYFKFPAFNSKVKNLMAKLPWVSDKEVKSSSLTKKEINEKMDDIAEYYLSMGIEDAADRLYLIKRDDEELYSNLIKLMNKKSSAKTSEIIKLVRNLESKGDLLAYLHNEITHQQQNRLNSELYKLENQDLLITIKEIKNILNSEDKSRKELTDIFNYMDEEVLANAIYYLDEESKIRVLNLLDDSKRSSIESQILAVSNKKLELKDLAKLYETKPLESVIKEIGNTEQHSMEELGVIYSNLPILKAAEILSQISDDDFVKDVLAAIRREQNLNNTESSSDKISRAIEFTKEYNSKINELVQVYEQMSPEKIALITEKMINNNATVTALELDSEPAFEVTDADIIIDVLSKLKDKTLSKVISYMSTENAYKLTQMLAKP